MNTLSIRDTVDLLRIAMEKASLRDRVQRTFMEYGCPIEVLELSVDQAPCYPNVMIIFLSGRAYLDGSDEPKFLCSRQAIDRRMIVLMKSPGRIVDVVVRLVDDAAQEMMDLVCNPTGKED